MSGMENKVSSINRVVTAVGIGILSVLMTFPVAAVPTLQLDIVGGTYDTSDQTIVTDSDSFDLVAYGKVGSVTTTEDYFISIALTPKTGPTAPSDIGSFVFAGNTIDIDDMVYGTPPVDSVETNPDSELGPHNIFETFYIEIAFTFDDLLTRDLVNTQDTTGSDPTANDPGDGSGALFYQTFSVDVSGLLQDFELHFDLYNTVVSSRNSEDIGPDDFAPFSHDAATQVPEPTPLVLLGLGLIALFVSRNRFLTKRINK